MLDQYLMPSATRALSRTLTAAEREEYLVGNLAAITTGLGDNVTAALYWDGGHAVNFDSPDLMSRLGELTGYSA